MQQTREVPVVQIQGQRFVLNCKAMHILSYVTYVASQNNTFIILEFLRSRNSLAQWSPLLKVSQAILKVSTRPDFHLEVQVGNNPLPNSFGLLAELISCGCIIESAQFFWLEPTLRSQWPHAIAYHMGVTNVTAYSIQPTRESLTSGCRG